MITKYMSDTIAAFKCWIVLKLLLIVGIFSPNWSNWLRRLLFIMTTYNELRRHNLLAHLQVEQLNQRLLNIQDSALLSAVAEVTQWQVINLDLDKLRKEGVDVDTLPQRHRISNRDIEVLGNEIVDKVPKNLRYDEVAMRLDVVRLVCPNYWAAN